MKNNLSERMLLVLIVVIDSYMEYNEPLGSRTLTKRYGLDFSPATMRNIILDTIKSILDSFDDAIFSPVGMMGLNLYKLSIYATNKDLNLIESFLINREVKYPTGHPTILIYKEIS